jgi:hypothetical protein
VRFRFTYSINNELADNGSIKERVLKQIFFIFNAQITYEKRFIVNQVLLIDDIFKINRLDLILLMIIGVTNTDKNFSATYSFAKFKARILFNFIFKCLMRFILINNIAEAYIVFTN